MPQPPLIGLATAAVPTEAFNHDNSVIMAKSLKSVRFSKLADQKTSNTLS